jgi:SAM-dependent methyltransferase
MSLAYKLLYAIGFTPWEQIADLPAVTGRASELFDREERGSEPPYGPVLDLGCGSGIWGVALAKRGWQVTGVDIVPKALRRARERAREAGVETRLVEGDVTKLRAAGVGSGYPFLLDFGLFHDELSDEQRERMGREVSAVAAPGATLLMVAWAPRRRGTAAARREPRRHRGRLPRLGCDRRGRRRRVRGAVLQAHAEGGPAPIPPPPTLSRGPAQATRPPAGSMGSPFSTHALSPPAMLYAS